MPQILRDPKLLHPILLDCHTRIQKQILGKYNCPLRLFETGRLVERQAVLVRKGKSTTLVSRHFFRIDTEPKVLSTAVDYVYHQGHWSWDLRKASIKAWYELFGELVLDICPELDWGRNNRYRADHNHFELKQEILEAHKIVTLSEQEEADIRAYLSKYTGIQGTDG